MSVNVNGRMKMEISVAANLKKKKKHFACKCQTYQTAKRKQMKICAFSKIKH